MIFSFMSPWKEDHHSCNVTCHVFKFLKILVHRIQIELKVFIINKSFHSMEVLVQCYHKLISLWKWVAFNEDVHVVGVVHIFVNLAQHHCDDVLIICSNRFDIHHELIYKIIYIIFIMYFVPYRNLCTLQLHIITVDELQYLKIFL